MQLRFNSNYLAYTHCMNEFCYYRLSELRGMPEYRNNFFSCLLTNFEAIEVGISKRLRKKAIKFPFSINQADRTFIEALS